MGKLANLMAELGHLRFGNLGNVEQNPNCGPSPLLGEDWNAKMRPICLWLILPNSDHEIDEIGGFGPDPDAKSTDAFAFMVSDALNLVSGPSMVLLPCP